MLKKILIQAISVMLLTLCSLTCHASAESGYVEIEPVRTGAMNTYMLNVNFCLTDTNSYIADEIASSVRPRSQYKEVQTPYTCTVTANGNSASFGNGMANAYFDKTGTIYWTVPCTFTVLGNQTITATIYRDGCYVTSGSVTINVSTPFTFYTPFSGGSSNHALATQLICRINKARLDSGICDLYADDAYMQMAQYRLASCLSRNSFSHSDIDKYNAYYGLSFKKQKEVFITGAANTDEVIELMKGSRDGCSILYDRDYTDIAVAVICNDLDVLHWIVIIGEA